MRWGAEFMEQIHWWFYQHECACLCACAVCECVLVYVHVCNILYMQLWTQVCSVLKPSKNQWGGLDICVIYGTLRIFNSLWAAAWQCNKEKRYQITKVSSLGGLHELSWPYILCLFQWIFRVSIFCLIGLIWIIDYTGVLILYRIVLLTKPVCRLKAAA